MLSCTVFMQGQKGQFHLQQIYHYSEYKGNIQDGRNGQSKLYIDCTHSCEVGTLKNPL